MYLFDADAWALCFYFIVLLYECLDECMSDHGGEMFGKR